MATVRVKTDIYYVPDAGKPVHENPDAVTITMTGTDYMQSTQLIGTSDEAITMEEIGTLGWVMIENLDATNFLDIGLTGSMPYNCSLVILLHPSAHRLLCLLRQMVRPCK